MNKKILIAIIFGLFGSTTEIFFTAFSKLFSSIITQNNLDFSLKGESYVWMFFIYSLISPMYDIGFPKIKNHNVIIRVALYGIIILTIEFIMGFLLEFFLGKCPWEYTSGIIFFGYIRLDYIFFWMFFGFIIERFYLLLNNRITPNN